MIEQVCKSLRHKHLVLTQSHKGRESGRHFRISLLRVFVPLCDYILWLRPALSGTSLRYARRFLHALAQVEAGVRGLIVGHVLPSHTQSINGIVYQAFMRQPSRVISPVRPTTPKAIARQPTMFTNTGSSELL